MCFENFYINWIKQVIFNLCEIDFSNFGKVLLHLCCGTNTILLTLCLFGILSYDCHWEKFMEEYVPAYLNLNFLDKEKRLTIFV